MKAIFANGLAELAPSVPPYWRCYAQGYFLGDQNVDASGKRVAACIEEHSLSHADPRRGETGGFTSATIVSTVPPRITAVAGELHIHGSSHVHFTVSEHGIPVGFQVVQAVGAGMDEETLRAVSSYQFQPALRNEKEVPADLDVTLKYATSP